MPSRYSRWRMLDMRDDVGRDHLRAFKEMRFKSGGNQLVNAHRVKPAADFVWVPRALVVAGRRLPVRHQVRALVTAPALLTSTTTPASETTAVDTISTVRCNEIVGVHKKQPCVRWCPGLATSPPMSRMSQPLLIKQGRSIRVLEGQRFACAFSAAFVGLTSRPYCRPKYELPMHSVSHICRQKGR